MKIEAPALVWADAETGNAYCRRLTETEALIVMNLLADETTGEVKATPVQPFMLKSAKK